MSYRNLTQTLEELDSCGWTELTTKLLSETNRPILIERSYLMEFDSQQTAKRLRRLLYELLFFYPLNKSRIRLGLEGNNLRIRLR